MIAEIRRGALAQLKPWMRSVALHFVTLSQIKKISDQFSIKF